MVGNAREKACASEVCQARARRPGARGYESWTPPRHSRLIGGVLDMLSMIRQSPDDKSRAKKWPASRLHAASRSIVEYGSRRRDQAWLEAAAGQRAAGPVQRRGPGIMPGGVIPRGTPWLGSSFAPLAPGALAHRAGDALRIYAVRREVQARNCRHLREQARRIVVARLFFPSEE